MKRTIHNVEYTDYYRFRGQLHTEGGVSSLRVFLNIPPWDDVRLVDGNPCDQDEDIHNADLSFVQLVNSRPGSSNIKMDNTLLIGTTGIDKEEWKESYLKTAIRTQEQAIQAINKGKIPYPYYLYTMLVSRIGKMDSEHPEKETYKNIANALNEKYPQFVTFGQKARERFIGGKKKNVQDTLYNDTYAPWPELVPYPFGVDRLLTSNIIAALPHLPQLRQAALVFQEDENASCLPKVMRGMIYDYIAGETVPFSFKKLLNDTAGQEVGKRSFVERCKEEEISENMTKKLLETMGIHTRVEDVNTLASLLERPQEKTKAKKGCVIA